MALMKIVSSCDTVWQLRTFSDDEGLASKSLLCQGNHLDELLRLNAHLRQQLGVPSAGVENEWIQFATTKTGHDR